MKILSLLLLIASLIAQENSCVSDNSVINRSYYSVGDTLSIEDQAILFPVCNGSDNYLTGDSFSFSDFNGSQNGGDYKITLISMNATW